MRVQPNTAGCHPACTTCPVRTLSLCAAAGEPGLAAYADGATEAALSRGAPLFRQGEPARHVHIVTAGTVKLHHIASEGRQHILGFAGPGDLVGLDAGEEYGFGAEALTPVGVCRVPRGHLRAVLDRHPAMARRALDIACAELAKVRAHMLLLTRPAATRCAAFLLSLPVDNDQPISVNRTEMAAHLGLTLETVSRSVTAMTRSGAVERCGTDLLLRDRATLQAMAA